MQPTHEQQRCLDLFGTGDPLIIEAGAGTGKTTTLKLLAESAPERTGTYVAFNTAIVNESRAKMPMTVDCATAHSLAMRAVGRRYQHRLRSERQQSYKIARHLGLGHLTVRYGSQTKVLQPGQLAGYVMKAIRNFCMSADPFPTVDHIAYVDGIDPPDSDGKHTHKNNDELRGHLAPALAVAWADLQKEDGVLRFEHDHYLKMWQLQDPKIPGDFILFDEGQDASPVMLAAVAAQDAQLVIVGDSQQQIYEWRGAVNALAQVEAERAFLTQSWRFGPAIADIANQLLDQLGAELRLSGTPTIGSVVDRCLHPNAILARSNSAAVETVLRLQREGVSVHLVGGGDDIVRFAKAAAILQDGEQVFHPELACFSSWREVQEYVEQDPQGSDLKVMVQLVDEYGVDTILQALEQTTAEAQAETVVSTAHKAKGREWARVKLTGDFPEELDPRMPGELRLMYVACTRAQERLDVGMVGALAGLVQR